MDDIHVAVRIRPLNNREKTDNHVNALTYSSDSISLTPYPSNPDFKLAFTFDKIFGEQDTNSSVYESLAKDIINSTLDGINGTIFAYGQTSSGKTFTMHGTNSLPGIIGLAINDIFQYIESNQEKEFLLRVSYLEIYNENIKDLLDPTNDNLKIHENVHREIFIGDLSEHVVLSPQDVVDILYKGESNRHVGVTNMNDRSSRSHTIFKMVIESRDKGDIETSAKSSNSGRTSSRPSLNGGAVRVSCLNLVDLAGSERVGHTGAEGLRLKEGGHINKSLLALASVIQKLSDGGDKHIPYRDSKLTRILQPSLGGNAKTAIICTITPSSGFVDETISTLKFASRAKIIKNKPQVNEVISDEALLKRYEKEISQLKSQLAEIQNENRNPEKSEVLKRKLEQEELEKVKLRNDIERLKNMILNSPNQEEALHPQKKLKHRRRTWFPQMISNLDFATASGFESKGTQYEKSLSTSSLAIQTLETPCISEIDLVELATMTDCVELVTAETQYDLKEQLTSAETQCECFELATVETQCVVELQEKSSQTLINDDYKQLVSEYSVVLQEKQFLDMEYESLVKCSTRDLQMAEMENQQLKALIEEMKQTMAQDSIKNEKLESENNCLKSDFEILNQQNIAIQSKFNKEKEMLVEQVTELTSKLENFKENESREAQKLQNDHQFLHQQFEALFNINSSLKDQLDQLIASEQELLVKNSELRDDQSTLRAENAQLKEEITESKADFSSLFEAFASHVTEMQSNFFSKADSLTSPLVERLNELENLAQLLPQLAESKQNVMEMQLSTSLEQRSEFENLLQVEISKNQQLSASISSLIDENNNLKAEIDLLNLFKSENSTKIDELQDKLSEFEILNRELKMESEFLTKQLESASEKINEHSIIVQNLQEYIAKQEQEVKTSDSIIQNVLEVCFKLRNEPVSPSELVEFLENNLNSNAQLTAALERTNADGRLIYEKYMRSKTVIKDLNAKLEAEINSNSSQKRSLEDKITVISAMRDQLLSKRNKLELQNSQLQESLKIKESELEAVSSELTNLKQENSEFLKEQKNTNSLCDQFNLVKQENSELIEAANRLQSELVKMQSKLDSINLQNEKLIELKSLMQDAIKDSFKSLEFLAENLSELLRKSWEIRFILPQMNENPIEGTSLLIESMNEIIKSTIIKVENASEKKPHSLRMVMATESEVQLKENFKPARATEKKPLRQKQEADCKQQ